MENPRKDDVAAGREAPAHSATASAQLKAQFEQQAQIPYGGGGGTPGSANRNVGTATKVR